MRRPAADPAVKPRVHVLLATYNGERHLARQWASLEEQQGVDVVVHVGDDGSQDGTVEVLRRLAAAHSGAVVEVRWLDEPPRRSATRSFMMLLQSALEGDPQAGWVAVLGQGAGGWKNGPWVEVSWGRASPPVFVCEMI